IDMEREIKDSDGITWTCIQAFSGLSDISKAEDIGSSVEEVRKGVVKGTQRGIENIKGNTQNAAEDAGNAVKRAVD
ncbi:hypothetical protein LC574_35515, partial [Nostoc sp. CHAB 5715]|nr:hypothetical protein [Nostoc sp. CHAB 5715]